MKIFIFEYIDQVSGNWHPGGGLAVVARDRGHVEEIIEEWVDIEITEEEWVEVVVYKVAEDAEPRVFVFPDSGCC